VTLSSIGDAVIVTDAKGYVTFMNPVAQSLTGWAADEARSKPLEEIFPIINEASRAKVENPVNKVLETGSVVELANHTLLLARNGIEFHIDDSAAPIKDAQGNVFGVVLVFRDVSERKRGELARLRLSAIVDSSDDAIISKTLDSTITSWNKAAERIFGYRADEVIGKTIYLLIPPELHHEEQMILDRLRRGERIDHYETVRLTKGGERLNISLTISPIKDSEGLIIGASKIARDITEQRRAEQSQAYLAAIVESSDDAIVGKTLEGIITSWNRGAEKIFGYTEQEAIGQPIYLIIPPERYPEEEMILSKLRKGERIEHFETIRQRKDGRLINISVTISPIRNRAGQIIGASKIARDVTEIKRGQIERQQLFEREQAARARAEEASRLKDDFLATVSHELRTPLNAILGWSKLLQAGRLDQTGVARATETILRNAEAQNRLIEDILDVSRIITGRLRLNVSNIELVPVIEAALESVRPAAEAKGVRLHRILDTTAGIVSGDSERLQQVVWNLLSNAIKFTPRDGQVQVRLERVASHLEIIVSDTGIGIKEEFLPYVFDRFRQADASSTRQHGG
ncbi:MAG TPA: PAS domain S-box protein, partial [Blastocatellia bacterium]|nr:PAS domain S-box protein [Blastocatellia bacterium]